MTLPTIFITLFEIALVLFVVWALFHEDRFAAFERKIFYMIRRRRNIKLVKDGRGQTAAKRSF